MTPFIGTLLNLISEKCDENLHLRRDCQTIGLQILDAQKQELRSINAHEEMISLTIDTGYSQSMFRAENEKDEAENELNSLLKDFYNEHLKHTFDIDDSELEKITNYDELKIHVETRDSVNMFQQICWRKIETAKKMEERNIAKQYRQEEKEFLESESVRIQLEENVNSMELEFKECGEIQMKQNKLIVELIEGAKHLNNLYPSRSQSQFQIYRTKEQNLRQPTFNINIPKGGLSSRFHVNFQQFAMPQLLSTMPRIQTNNQRNALNNLLQQSEVILKSMQSCSVALSAEVLTPKLPGILKMSNDFTKPSEGSQKTVSFGVDSHRHITNDYETQELTLAETDCSILDPLPSEIIIDDSEIEEIPTIRIEPKRQIIEIKENRLIRPADKIPINNQKLNLPKSGSIKRKSNADDDSERDVESPVKIKKLSPPQKSTSFAPKSFMDMFLSLSKDNDTPQDIPSPAFEPVKPKPKISKTNDGKEKKNRDVKQNAKPFDNFEEMFSKFTGSNNNDQQTAAGDMSFDFFGGDDDAEDKDGEDNDGNGSDISFQL